MPYTEASISIVISSPKRQFSWGTRQGLKTSTMNIYVQEPLRGYDYTSQKRSWKHKQLHEIMKTIQVMKTKFGKK